MIERSTLLQRSQRAYLVPDVVENGGYVFLDDLGLERRVDLLVDASARVVGGQWRRLLVIGVQTFGQRFDVVVRATFQWLA